jgi:hypothetical protein
VLFLGEDGIVGLQAVLLEERLALDDLDVEKRVANAEKLVSLASHGGRYVRMR